jgi:hypothetical protein
MCGGKENIGLRMPEQKFQREPNKRPEISRHYYFIAPLLSLFWHVDRWSLRKIDNIFISLVDLIEI